MLSTRKIAAKTAYKKGYRVQADGSVVSPKGKLRKLMRGRNGYPKISISISGKSHPVPVHVLAAYQLYGGASFEPGTEVRHLNDDKLDNSLSNISIGTSSDNKMDRSPSSRHASAMIATSHVRKIGDDQIGNIRKMRADGSTLQSIANRYGVVKSTIHRVLSETPGRKSNE